MTTNTFGMKTDTIRSNKIGLTMFWIGALLVFVGGWLVMWWVFPIWKDSPLEKFDGTMSPEVERVVFERGNAAGVLLYDEEDETVLLTKQFRYPAYMHDGPGWIIEIVAGVLDKGRDMISVASASITFFSVRWE